MDRDPIPEKREKQLHELTAQFLRSPDPSSPDPNLVGRLYMATFEHIVRHLADDAGDREVAEDAVQEAFKALQAHFQKSAALPEEPMAYLLTVARNFLRKRGRNVKRHREMAIDAIDSSVADRMFADKDEEGRDPFAALASDEVKEELSGASKEALKDLDKTTREVIKLHRKGKNWPQIGQKLGIPPEIARKKWEHAVHHVKAAFGEHFSSYVTTAEPEVRRWVSSRKSAQQAIDLLPPPYAEILQLILVKKTLPKNVALLRDSSPETIERQYQRGIELFHKKYKMTEAQLKDVLENGK